MISLWGRRCLMISFKGLLPATKQETPDILIITQTLTSLTFVMFEAANRLWHKEDATFALTLMCQNLARHLSWLDSRVVDKSVYDDFFETLSNLATEMDAAKPEHMLMMLGCALDRDDNYSTAEWCAVVLCVARKMGYEFDF